MDLGDVDGMFVEAMGQLRRRYSDKVMARVSLTHERLFNTDKENSLDMASSYLAPNRWKEEPKNERICLEARTMGKMWLLQ